MRGAMMAGEATTPRTTPMNKKTDKSQRQEKPGAGEDQAKPGKPIAKPPGRATERGGPKGLEPTRYGDWERKGIAVDF